MDYATLNFKELIPTLDGAVLVVTLNRSKQRNTFSTGLADELERVFQLADEDDRVRVVITTAAPDAPAYCSGADLSAGWGGLGGKGSPYETREPGGNVSLAVYNCRKITIAAVNGHAAGVGMTGMQLPYDFRFVWEGAKLAFPFVRRGIAPEALSSFFLPSLLGMSRAKALFLSGTVLAPSSPLLAGLYHSIIPKKEDVFPSVLAFARELAANTSQTAVAMTKSLLVHPPVSGSLEEVVEMESRTLSMLSKEGDAREAGKAFLEKRAPRMADGLGVLDKAGEWYPWWNRQAKL
ncbi:peroxisomal enoyl-CoA-hydratase [Hymenopellis radicata]|nr:peroxisomal enoyl-CoA-hydratase [Hymenopellis radicata]